jgi:hypothetical protein
MRRKKNRATRKDAPTVAPILDWRWGRWDAGANEIVYDPNPGEPVRVHVTRNGRGCVAGLREK